MKKILLLITLAYTSLSFSQQTYVPDNGLEARLQQLGLDSGALDGYVLTSNINTLENFSPGNFDIKDLTGLQDFIALKDLTIRGEVVDLSPIEGLNLLEYLSINDVTETSIDLSIMSYLEFLNISDTSLTSVNLSNNNRLTEVVISDSPITQIIFPNNPLLEEFDISNTHVENLDFTGCTELSRVSISKNSLMQNINIIESTILQFFTARDNPLLTSLNLSNNYDLTRVEIINNTKLISINIKNGNNTAIGQRFIVKDNILLDCVQVDDVAWSLVYWAFNTSNFAGFSTDCSVTNNLTRIPDTNFEQRLITLGFDRAPINGMVHTPNISSVKSLSVSGINISDLTGIEDFTSLETLRVFDNSLTTLDLSKNLELKDLRCFNNQLTTLNVSKNTKLEDLRAFDNSISALNLSANNLLKTVKVNNNNLNTFNLKNGNNTNITTFEANGNANLTCIDVDDVSYANSNFTAIDAHTVFRLNCSLGSNITNIPDTNFEQYLIDENIDSDKILNGQVLTADIENITQVILSNKNISDLTGIQDFVSLTELNAANNQITSIDLSKNILLEKLFVANNQLTTIDVSNNTKLKTLDVGENSLTNLSIHQLVDLETLSCYKNQLTEINLYSNKNLLAFIANENQLKTVDIRENKNLFWIDLDDNLLEDLMLKNENNTKITTFSATGNPNLTCIEVDDVNFSNTNFTEKDASANYSTDCTPANNDCSNATPLVLGQETPGDIISGTFTNATDCVAGTIIADVWFSITVPETGEFSIEGIGYGGLLKFAIYESCSSTSAISCGVNISLDNLTPGDVYYLKVWMEASSGGNKSRVENGTFILTSKDSSVLSVDNFTEENSYFRMYPNPAKTEVTLSIHSVLPAKKVEIYNLLGKKVLNKSLLNRNLTINTSTLSKGMYIVKVFLQDKSISKKLLIH